VRGIGMAGRCNRVDRYHGLLTLELIYRADTSAWQSLLYFEDLRVGRDNHDIFQRDLLFLTVAIDPNRFALQNAVYKRGDGLRLLRRGVLIPVCAIGR